VHAPEVMCARPLTLRAIGQRATAATVPARRPGDAMLPPQLRGRRGELTTVCAVCILTLRHLARAEATSPRMTWKAWESPRASRTRNVDAEAP
jgi:hypothetical protein